MRAMSEAQKTILVWAALIASIALCVASVISYQYYQDHRSKPTTVKTSAGTTATPTDTGTTASPPTEPPKVTCEDVTTYDHNWNNDVVCTNPDGSQFYTDYAGGNKYGYNFPD